MAENVSYVITIRSEGAETAESPKGVAPTATGESVDGGSKNDTQKTSASFESFYKQAKKIAKCAPAAYATRYVDLAITTSINRVELRTGLSTLQGQQEYAYSLTKRMLASGAAIAGGIITGNPLVALGGAMSMVNIGIQNVIAEENLNIQRQVEGIGIEQANIRAGASGGRSGR
jgi:hypothetical protein